jgi:hypothetical protein
MPANDSLELSNALAPEKHAVAPMRKRGRLTGIDPHPRKPVTFGRKAKTAKVAVTTVR